MCGYLGGSGCKLRAGGKGGETFYGLYEWACVLSTGTTVRIVEFTSEGLGSEVNTCIHEGGVIEVNICNNLAGKMGQFGREINR